MLWVPFFQNLFVKRMFVSNGVKTGEQRKKLTKLIITYLTVRLKPEPRLVSALALDFLRSVGRLIIFSTFHRDSLGSFLGFGVSAGKLNPGRREDCIG